MGNEVMTGIHHFERVGTTNTGGFTIEFEEAPSLWILKFREAKRSFGKLVHSSSSKHVAYHARLNFETRFFPEDKHWTAKWISFAMMDFVDKPIQVRPYFV